MPKLSRTIDRRQVVELIAAADFAAARGTVLNTHVTIMWSLTRAGDDPRGHLLAAVRTGLRKFLHRHGIAFTGVWVRERPNGHDAEHAHFVFHLPPALRRKIGRVVRRLVKHYAGRLRANAIKVTYYSKADIRYLLKGAGPDVQVELDIRAEWRVSQGSISGKRAGVTQNLGPAARRAFGQHEGVRIGSTGPVDGIGEAANSSTVAHLQLVSE
jgi:hypothetical protein